MAMAIALTIFIAATGRAHPIVEHAIDVVIDRDQITIDAYISPEQLLLVENSGSNQISPKNRSKLLQQHSSYLAHSLKVMVDTQQIPATSSEWIGSVDSSVQGLSPNALLPYRLVYNLPHKPAGVRIEQDFLREHAGWSAMCVLKIRQSDQPNPDSMMLTRENAAEFSCEWKKTANQGGSDSVSKTKVGTDAHGCALLAIIAGFGGVAFLVARRSRKTA